MQEDLTSDLESEDEDETTADETVDPAKYRKLQAENRSLRTRLRRSEIGAKYGSEVVELIPDELPLGKWEAFAEKLAGRLKTDGAGPADETETAAVAPVAPTPEASRLGAVATGGSGAGLVAPPRTYTPQEVRKIGLRDHAEALKIIASGAMQGGSG